MKKLILIMILFLFIKVNGYGQKPEVIEMLKNIEGHWQVDTLNNTVYIQTIVEIPNQTKEQIYYNLHEYLTISYNDANNFIQLDDKEKGLIISKGAYGDIRCNEVMSRGASEYTARYIIKFDIQDNKTRITIELTDINVYYPGFFSTKTYTDRIYDYYPINDGGSENSEKTAKTREGYVFYKIITKALNTMEIAKKRLLFGTPDTTRKDVLFGTSETSKLSAKDSLSLYSFYPEFNKIYKHKVATLGLSVASGVFIGVAFLTDADTQNVMFVLSGACALLGAIIEISNITQIKKIRNKSANILFTPNGLILKF